MRLKIAPALVIAALMALVVPAAADVCIGASCTGHGSPPAAKPVISISDAIDGGHASRHATHHVTEGNDCKFTIHRSGNLNQRSTVHYNAVDGSAVSSDYSLPPHEGPAVAAFPPGKANFILLVHANDVQDDVEQADPQPETFSIHLVKPGNATIGDGTATCSIVEVTT